MEKSLIRRGRYQIPFHLFGIECPCWGAKWRDIRAGAVANSVCVSIAPSEWAQFRIPGCWTLLWIMEADTNPWTGVSPRVNLVIASAPFRLIVCNLCETSRLISVVMNSSSIGCDSISHYWILWIAKRHGLSEAYKEFEYTYHTLKAEITLLPYISVFRSEQNYLSFSYFSLSSFLVLKLTELWRILLVYANKPSFLSRHFHLLMDLSRSNRWSYLNSSNRVMSKA